MNLPHLVVRPEKRYDSRGRAQRGARRHDGLQGRTLALFDTLNVRKRAIRTHIALSEKGYRALVEMAVKNRVSTSGLAAYLVESAVRQP